MLQTRDGVSASWAVVSALGVGGLGCVVVHWEWIEELGDVVGTAVMWFRVRVR